MVALSLKHKTKCHHDKSFCSATISVLALFRKNTAIKSFTRLSLAMVAENKTTFQWNI